MPCPSDSSPILPARRRLLLAGLALPLQQTAFGATGWRVSETFEVGAQVYVRSLLAEPETGTLWVGTSAGV
ncbi:MAG: hypothetical protein AB9M60_15060, partial [Leptothrix sp. (in: b-proteobacteria)]